ncbi:MAG: M20/M25/M40 family metallo-hydrolase, partial [Lachnospiraceae bacterium]|nr:M20/M25/M40 family metallo-hydrolase [Lachnospiraceae bacterium]
MYYLDHFKKLCSIPHGSYHTEEITAYCIEFAKENGLAYRTDEAGNVVIIKEASEGYENEPTVMLQGHLDMVCEKEKDIDFDFLTQPLDLIEEDGWLKARGTTLGGDDGVAIAYCMAVLTDNTLKHPRLECVFTTQEEVGMDGAAALDTSDLKAAYLINLDTENEG